MYLSSFCFEFTRRFLKLKLLMNSEITCINAVEIDGYCARDDTVRQMLFIWMSSHGS